MSKYFNQYIINLLQQRLLLALGSGTLLGLDFVIFGCLVKIVLKSDGVLVHLSPLLLALGVHGGDTIGETASGNGHNGDDVQNSGLLSVIDDLDLTPPDGDPEDQQSGEILTDLLGHRIEMLDDEIGDNTLGDQNEHCDVRCRHGPTLEHTTVDHSFVLKFAVGPGGGEPRENGEIDEEVPGQRNDSVSQLLLSKGSLLNTASIIL